jgi:hypothetical protein
VSESTSIEIAPNVRLKGDGEDSSERELHAADGAMLPALCIDCGAAVRGKPDVRVYRGFAPGAWWLFLFKAGTRAIVIRLFGRKVRVGAFVCSDHVSSRRTKSLIGLLGVILALPLLIGLAISGLSSGIAMLIFFVWTIAALAIRWSGTDLLSAKGITPERVAVFETPNDKFVQAVVRSGTAAAAPRTAAPVRARAQ